MYLLNDLWNGNLNPGERSVNRSKEYRKLAKEANDCMEQLTAELSPKLTEMLDQFLDKNLQLFSITEEDTFIHGVRIGAQLILDVIGD